MPTPLTLLINGLMAEQGLTVDEVARRSGMGRSTVYTYTLGRARGAQPRTGTFEKLAKGLGIDASELYAAADRADARGEQRLISYYRQIGHERDRAEAIETVRRIAWRARPNE